MNEGEWEKAKMSYYNYVNGFDPLDLLKELPGTLGVSGPTL